MLPDAVRRRVSAVFSAQCHSTISTVLENPASLLNCMYPQTSVALIFSGEVDVFSSMYRWYSLQKGVDEISSKTRPGERTRRTHLRDTILITANNHAWRCPTRHWKKEVACLGPRPSRSAALLYVLLM